MDLARKTIVFFQQGALWHTGCNTEARQPFGRRFGDTMMNRLKSVLFATSLVAGLAAGLASAIAQPAAPASAPTSTYDPAQLPQTKGRVVQYLLNPRGMVDGLLLDSGTEVHFNPMVATEMVFAVRPGEMVTVHGLKARSVPVVMAMSVTNDATGKTVTAGTRMRTPDSGPRDEHGAMHPQGNSHHGMTRGAMAPAGTLELSGKIKSVLHNPRGETDGVLLEDGSQVRLPPPEAKRLADQIKPGSMITARGPGSDGLLGKVVAARQIGPDATHLADIRGPHTGPGRGMMGHGKPSATGDAAPAPK